MSRSFLNSGTLIVIFNPQSAQKVLISFNNECFTKAQHFYIVVEALTMKKLIILIICRALAFYLQVLTSISGVIPKVGILV